LISEEEKEEKDYKSSIMIHSS